MATDALAMDWNTLDFTETVQLRNGKLVKLPTDLYIKIPSLRTPFGYSQYEAIDVSLTKELEDHFTKLDDLVIRFSVENSDKLFGKQMTREVVEVLQSSIVKKPKKPEYPSTLRLKTSTTTKVFDSNGSDWNINLSDIKACSRIECVVCINGLWIIGGKVGLSLKLAQVKVVASESNTPDKWIGN